LKKSNKRRKFYNNKFTLLEKNPPINAWLKLGNNLEYNRVPVSDLPEEVRENGLTTKFNSAIVAISGSTEHTVVSVIGLRPDKGNVIDEHSMVYYYDNVNSINNFGGIIHHGNWQGRTTTMTDQQVAAIEASGLTAAFTYKEIPLPGSGSLQNLDEKGMLTGLSKQFKILIENKKK